MLRAAQSNFYQVPKITQTSFGSRETYMRYVIVATSTCCPGDVWRCVGAWRRLAPTDVAPSWEGESLCRSLGRLQQWVCYEAATPSQLGLA